MTRWGGADATTVYDMVKTGMDTTIRIEMKRSEFVEKEITALLEEYPIPRCAALCIEVNGGAILNLESVSNKLILDFPDWKPRIQNTRVLPFAVVGEDTKEGTRFVECQELKGLVGRQVSDIVFSERLFYRIGVVVDRNVLTLGATEEKVRGVVYEIDSTFLESATSIDF